MNARPPSRGRPNAERSAAIERAIQDSALALFSDVGYDSTTMEAIATAAGVSKGTLYARYAGKEQLFRALLDTEISRWSARAGAQDHLLPREMLPRMRHHARTLIRVFGWPDFQRMSQLLNSVSTQFPELVREWHQIGSVNYLEFLAADMAESAKVEGRVQGNWILLAGILLHTLTSWYRTETIYGPVSEEKAFAYADDVIDALFRSTR